MNTTLQIRIDSATKAKAQKTFKALGIDLSSGVKLFLNQVVIEQCFPFVPSTKKTRALRKQFDREAREALASGVRYKTAEEAHASII